MPKDIIVPGITGNSTLSGHFRFQSLVGVGYSLKMSQASFRGILDLGKRRGGVREYRKEEKSKKGERERRWEGDGK